VLERTKELLQLKQDLSKLVDKIVLSLYDDKLETHKLTLLNENGPDIIITMQATMEVEDAKAPRKEEADKEKTDEKVND